MTRRALFQAALAIGVSDERDLHEFARRIFDRANELRSLRGAPVLQWREDLARCAREQSLRKAKLRFPGHNDPERGDIAQRLRTAGIPWTLCGENVFQERGWDDPVNFAIVFWWYSAGHQANMLNPAYTDSGVGVAQGL
ncbi:MAG TPA: CAP domain-containing protein, partial [Bryobacteraceae bacterium]|nr:CAP domain-containing protein [Bryobacteraceae bacterium]